MATFCPNHGSSTKAVLPESENPAGRRRRDVPAVLKPSNFIWGGNVLGHQLTYLAGGRGGLLIKSCHYSAWFGIERVILEAQAHDLAVGKWELGLVDLVHIPEAGAHGSQLR